MVTRPFLPVLLMALAGFTACGTETETDVTTLRTYSHEIKGGSIDSGNPSIVGLVTTSGYGIGTCSGTLIAPNLVLTAQHCVAEIGSEYIQCGRTSFGPTRSAAGVYVTTATYLTNDARDYFEVSEIVTAEKDDVCGNDIALLVLAENIPDTQAPPIVPRIDLPVYPGEDYTAIGYGHTGIQCRSDSECPGSRCDTRSGVCSDSGVRRILDGRRIQCEGLSCPNYAQVETAEFLGSSGTCQGDSGGPAIDRKGRVLGALSRGAGLCQSSTYSAVAGWGEWIQEWGMTAAERGGYEPPFWAVYGVSEIPENDLDVDGVFNDSDNCPDIQNADQSDADDDGLGDLCDDNSDDDELLDDDDNCPFDANADQLDTDGDGFGDVCDDDDDDDGVSDEADFCPTNPRFTDYGAECNITGDDLIIVTADDKGCSMTGNAPSSIASFAFLIGMLFRPRRRSRR